MDKRPKKRARFILVTERKPVWTLAFRTAGIYLLFGLAWILFSDLAVQFFVLNVQIQQVLSLVKGFFYVFLSAALIYVLIGTAFRKLSDSEQIIEENRSELKTLAYFDPVTSLPNRRRLIARFPDYLTEGGYTVSKAIFFIDVDNIKLINDTMGHVFGDELIRRIAERIHAFIALPDELYRLGGDEFVVLARFDEIPEILAKGTRIVHLFDEPFFIEQNLVHSSVSVGIALWPVHSDDPSELLKYADIAMYRAKREGKNRSCLFMPDMMESVDERMRMGELLHGALLKNELELAFQPQISSATRKIVGFEALLRWKSPTLGSVPPDRFIPVAEENHLIVPIGNWVLENACRFLVRLHAMGLGNLTISVNISIIQLLQENFTSEILKILSETGLKPEYLDLEITETVMMESLTLIMEHLENLRRLGVGIALDDFGKGYSSLSYLDSLPLTILKVDKNFIDTITLKGEAHSIVGNVVGMGKKLGLTVVAEGVETEEQFQYLARMECDLIQGWLFCKALPIEEAMDFAIQNLSGIGQPTTSA